MLNDTQVRNLRPKHKLYRVSDSHGLCIEINPNGSKLWRHRYRFNNKATMMALGTYLEVSLLDARQARDRNKQLLKQGINPKFPKIYSYRDNPDEISFKGMFLNWLNNKKDEWTLGYAEDTVQRANSYLLPIIGKMPIDQINSPIMLKLLLEIQDKGLLDTLQKVKGIANGVFSHSVGMGIITVNPVRDLPNDIFKKKPIKHHATITDPKEIGLLLNMLDQHIGSDEVNAALTIAPHVFLRPGELTGLLWSEVDFHARLIRINAERMKMKKVHLVPMSYQVLTTLKNLSQIDTGSDYVFPTPRNKNASITTNALLVAIRSLGIDKFTFTTHGFRHMASIRLNELGYRADIIELQLAHTKSNTVKAAYNHSDHIEERRTMMQEWSDHLAKLKDTTPSLSLSKATTIDETMEQYRKSKRKTI
ncbi:MAG: tyrosine-type recombinase/integrase [Candidatus Thioglobus autotrophicus]|nr:tyrosine-type recombinase/integrase [Candidatus Thioglobus autotrophicus]